MSTQPKFLAIQIAAARREHGSRAHYVGAGCRCRRCRIANAQYEAERSMARREGDRRHLVPADAAREHLAWLSSRNVGTRAVSDASGLNRGVVREIRSGIKTRIRASTERRILDVDLDAIADNALIPAGPTLRLVRGLVEEGYTKAWLAQQLGYRSHGLQFVDKITARNASRVERLARRIDRGEIAR